MIVNLKILAFNKSYWICKEANNMTYSKDKNKSIERDPEIKRW